MRFGGHCGTSREPIPIKPLGGFSVIYYYNILLRARKRYKGPEFQFRRFRNFSEPRFKNFSKNSHYQNRILRKILGWNLRSTVTEKIFWNMKIGKRRKFRRFVQGYSLWPGSAQFLRKGAPRTFLERVLEQKSLNFWRAPKCFRSDVGSFPLTFGEAWRSLRLIWAQCQRHLDVFC